LSTWEKSSLVSRFSTFSIRIEQEGGIRDYEKKEKGRIIRKKRGDWK